METIEKSLIYKSDLHVFLQKLKKEARHAYAVLTGAPVDYVWIGKSESMDDWYEEKFSIKEFLERYAGFKAHRDQFELCAKVYYFQEDWKYMPPMCSRIESMLTGEDTFTLDYKAELSVETITRELPNILAYICREAILANAPLSLVDESVKQQYGFKRTDIEKLRDIVIKCNLNIVKELRAEYDRLGAIDCVRDFVL